MIELGGKKYYTEKEYIENKKLQDFYDSCMYIMSLKDAMIESYKGQINILEEIIDKLMLEFKKLDMVLSDEIFAKYKEVLLEDFRQSDYAKLDKKGEYHD